MNVIVNQLPPTYKEIRCAKCDTVFFPEHPANISKVSPTSHSKAPDLLSLTCQCGEVTQFEKSKMQLYSV
jgi:RNase P subunit RPR2